MEFTELFVGAGIILVAIIAVFGMTASWNAAYGTNIGDDPEFQQTINRVENLLESKLVDEGLEYGQSTVPESGAGQSSEQNDNLISRALSTISLIPQLIGLMPALIKDAAVALNLPDIYWRLGQALFWIVFSITMAGFLLIGARTVMRR